MGFLSNLFKREAAHADARTRRDTAHLELLEGIARAETVDIVCRVTCTQAVTLYRPGGGGAILYLPVGPDGALQALAVAGADDIEWVQRCEAEGQPDFYRLALDGELIVAPDVRADPRTQKSAEPLEKHGYRGLALLPLGDIEDRGLLFLGSRDRDAFGPEAAAFMAVLRFEVQIALDRARLVEKHGSGSESGRLKAV